VNDIFSSNLQKSYRKYLIKKTALEKWIKIIKGLQKLSVFNQKVCKEKEI